MIDEELENVAVNFWDLTWNNIKRYLPYETRLLLSLTNREKNGIEREKICSELMEKLHHYNLIV